MNFDMLITRGVIEPSRVESNTARLGSNSIKNFRLELDRVFNLKLEARLVKNPLGSSSARKLETILPNINKSRNMFDSAHV